MTLNTETILTFFVAITAASVFLQACVLFAIFISLRKTAAAILEATGDLKATVIPMVHSTRELVERISPQVVTVTAGLADLTATLKRESAGVNVSLSEIMDRVRGQAQRLDAMLTASLDALERATVAVETAVTTPVRQVNGILAAVRAMVGAYRTTAPRQASRESGIAGAEIRR